MEFARESDMIAPLKRSLPALLCPRGPYAVACEVPDGGRVVDIMYAIMPDDSDGLQRAAPVAGKLSRISTAQTMVLALIWRERRVSSRRLGSLTYIREDKLEAEYLEPLHGLGLIETDKRSWVIGSWCQTSPAQLVAVEAKMRDWREAMSQAVDNRSRADLSYIALPSAGTLQNASQIRQSAREHGVGVIELHPSGAATVVVRARTVPAKVCRQKWQLSLRFLAAAVRGDGRWMLYQQSAGS
jgi:predicted nuclease with RNAse H fold